jgi:ABC-2 type transport system permease protein
MREARAFVTLTGVLILMAGVSYLLYRIALAAPRYSNTPLSPQIGQNLFFALALLELLMVCSIAPALTAGAISSEEEKLTYEMLLATPLRPASILWGKLFSALSYLFLLIFAAIPMASLIFIFGGVAPREMAKALVVIVAVAITFGVLGMFMSTWLRRTGRATVLSYLFVAILLFGTIFLYAAVGIISQSTPPRWLLVANPLSALFSALTPAITGETYPGGFLQSLSWALGGNLNLISGNVTSQTGIPRPLYHYSLPFYGLLTLVFYMLSSRLVRPTRRWSLTRREALLGLAIFLTYLGVVALAFLSSYERYEKISALFRTQMNPANQVVMERGVAVERFIAVPPVKVIPYPVVDFKPVNEISPSDEASIYSALLQYIYGFDANLTTSSQDLHKLYMAMSTDDSLAVPGYSWEESRPLGEELIAAINAELANLPVLVKWVEMSAETTFIDPESGAEITNDPVMVLGIIYLQEDGSVLVTSAMHTPIAGVAGHSYILGLVDGTWQVIKGPGGG